ncbi:citryl-CoA lyase [Candidatus Woesearchaeota archaeon]|nr:citryl-CoA lyase [Candidatus Woesearchaeota archaeon]
MPEQKEKVWKTNISGQVDNELIIHGYKLTDMIQKLNFTQAIFLMLQGKLPSKKEELIFNTILVATIDHGIGTPSTTVARTVRSCGNPLNTSIAAGILAQGDLHGGALEQAMEMIKSAIEQNKTAKEIVADALKNKKLLYGFGHKICKGSDPRTTAILEVLKKQKAISKYVSFAVEMEKEIEKQKGIKIPLNIDGINAAVALDLGFQPEMGKALFIIPRVAGLAAHCIEEGKQKTLRRLSPEEYEYTGMIRKKL